MKAGKHGFSGSCAPGYAGTHLFETFSLGIFEYIPKSNGKGVKKSAVKVRVKGSISQEAHVYRVAQKICDELDAGTYSGPKYVRV